MKRNVLFIISCFFAACSSFGQQSVTKWKATIETQKVFIENKGQFDGLNVPGKVLYGTDGHAGVFLFTKKGVSYRVEKREVKDRDARENIENEKESAGIKAGNAKEVAERNHVALVNVQWEGANPNVQVEATDELNSYFNFGMGSTGIDHARTFKKIVYKNLYPNIDVEYIFHPQTGIEYSLILHPGADISKVKMLYSGAEGLSLSGKGEIHIPTLFGDIIDHAPVSYYANDKANSIASSFVLKNKNVTFQLGNYDNSQTVVIDPWTVTPPALPTTNIAYYIKSDSLGNAYVYGGDAPFTLVKYNTIGGVVWTYSTNWDETSDWFGCLAVDRAGNAYITDGDGGTLAKINPAGTLVWSHNSSNGLTLTLEYWSMDFNCDQTELYIGGMWGPFPGVSPIGVFYGVVDQMNLTNGTIANHKEVSIVPQRGGFAINEVRSLCMSPNGNIYCVSLDTLASLTQSLSFNYRTMQTYNYDYYLPYSSGGGTGQGANNIRATSYFIYTTDGVALDKRDITTGNILTSTIIPGGSTQLNSGIAIDTCGNVYVGSQNQVVKYDANLNQLGTASTPAAVYDISIGRNGDVLACGPSFAVALAFNACPQVMPICYRIFTANLTATPPPCLGQCTGSATASTTNGTGPFSYLWSSGATTQTAANLCPGNYTVTVTDHSNNGPAVGYATIDSGIAFATNVVTYPPTCGQNNGKAIANIVTGGSSPFTYAWNSGGATTGVDSNLAPGTYSVTVTDVHNCSASAGAVLMAGSSLTLAPSGTSTLCSANNGTASVAVSGATGPFEYNWSNGATTSSITGLAAGTYTVTVQDTATGNAQFWSEYFTNGDTGWILNTPGTGTNGSSANQWVVNNDVNCNCTTGNYLHITVSSNPVCFICGGMAGQCTYLALASAFMEGDFTTDVLAISPVISTVGKSNISLGFTWESLGTPGTDYGLVDLSSDGGATWTALPTHYDNVSTCTHATINIPSNYQNITGFRMAFEWINAPGTFGGAQGNPPGFAIDSITLTAGGSSNCPATASVTVGTSANFTLAPSATSTSCGSNNGSATVTASGSSGYNYNWSNGDTTATINNLPSGNYTVTVSTAGGCSVTASASVASTFGIILANSAAATTCGNNNGSADVSVVSGGGPFTYSWSTGSTTSSITNVAPGSYHVTVSGAGGCSATSSAVVDSSSALVFSTSTVAAGCVTPGSASVNISSGTGPFTYLWSNSGSTAIVSNLSAGTYTVTVSGTGSCSATGSATVSSTGGAITLSPASGSTTCGSSNGSASVSIGTGTGPFTYAWSNSASTDSITGVPAGTYTVTVTGNAGCSAMTTAVIAPSSPVSATTSSTPTTCGGDNGSASVGATGGSGSYTYSWSNLATTATISNVASGNYTVTVTDLSGCTTSTTVSISPSVSTPVTITQNKALMCSGDSANLCAPSGYVIYAWNDGDNSQCFETTLPGNYYVTVTDNGGCSATSNHLNLAVYQQYPVIMTVSGDTLHAYGGFGYQWYFNNAILPGETSPVLVATQVGQYYVVQTDTNGCLETSSKQNITNVTGIAGISSDAGIKVYPNPLEAGGWKLEVGNDMLGATCEIYDASGKLVFATEVRNLKTEIDLEIAGGVYLMRIYSEQKNYTLKLIKL